MDMDVEMNGFCWIYCSDNKDCDCIFVIIYQERWIIDADLVENFKMNINGFKFWVFAGNFLALFKSRSVDITTVLQWVRGFKKSWFSKDILTGLSFFSRFVIERQVFQRLWMK